jgi:hypothetical protein
MHDHGISRTVITCDQHCTRAVGASLLFIHSDQYITSAGRERVHSARQVLDTLRDPAAPCSPSCLLKAPGAWLQGRMSSGGILTSFPRGLRPRHLQSKSLLHLVASLAER